ESVFSRFDAFDFEADRRFQAGLTHLKRDGGREESKVLELKLVFFNRFVEPIDGTGYKKWSCASPPPVTPADGGAEQPEQQTPSDCEISHNQTAETSAEPEVGQLSFAEVMRLVQEGKEVPGATKPDIKPTNQSPTPSHMERRLKPWEVSSALK
uniref:Uncharacterized protein n=1 Tax=Gasterosteus aculeatus TaxID=69293 RepID=G3PDY1_GASAC